MDDFEKTPGQLMEDQWSAVLDTEGLAPIKGKAKRRAVSQLLENADQEARKSNVRIPKGFLFEGEVPTNVTGAQIDNYDPILISLIRRAAPQMIPFEIMGTQPMTGPTGLIFALRSRYANQTGAEAFYNEANTAWATVVTGANTQGQKHVGTIPGNNSVTSNLAAQGIYNYGSAMSTAQAEALGSTSNVAWPEMAMSIDKVSVTAGSRALKANYSLELAQDLKAIHGLDAETELSNILTTEILAEINREAVRTVFVSAKQGSLDNTTTPGFFDLDVDANGRWSAEKFKGLMVHIDREANRIAKETRRGKGNIIICSSDVATALQFAGVLDYAPAIQNGLEVDDTGNTFAGILNNRYKVYIDPYAGGDYFVVGYKGASAWDAGLFYCPYVPLQMVRAVDPGTMSPIVGFKTRYGMVQNPFANGTTTGDLTGAISNDNNVYYRRSLVRNIL